MRKQLSRALKVARASCDEVLRDNHGGSRHAFRDKTIGQRTRYERRAFIYRAVGILHEEGLKILNIRNLKLQHIVTLTKVWERKGHSPAHLQTQLSQLRVFCGYIGKPDLVPKDLSILFVDPTCFRRTYNATEERTWDSAGIDIEHVVNKALDEEPLVAVQLLVQLAFGLRMAEAACMKPHVADREGHVLVHWGTKNGRNRTVEKMVTDPEYYKFQVEVLALAKTFCKTQQDSLIPRHYTLKAWRARYYYVLRKHCGVTRKQYGVSSHGLRHQFANHLYETLTKLDRPLKRIKKLSESERVVDRCGRQAVSYALGHRRTSISGAYIGGILRPSTN